MVTTVIKLSPYNCVKRVSEYEKMVSRESVFLEGLASPSRKTAGFHFSLVSVIFFIENEPEPIISVRIELTKNQILKERFRDGSTTDYSR
jgi:hypothetical protein